MTVISRRDRLRRGFEDQVGGLISHATACGQTISAPHMHGYALEYMFDALQKSDGAQQDDQQEMTKVLDVGCGSGYLTAALGRWVHPKDGTNEPRILSRPGKVYGYVEYCALCQNRPNSV